MAEKIRRAKWGKPTFPRNIFANPVEALFKAFGVVVALPIAALNSCFYCPIPAENTGVLTVTKAIIHGTSQT